MESLGINLNYLLLQIACLAIPSLGVVAGIILFIKKKRQQ